MEKTTNMDERVVKAARRYLELKDYELLGQVECEGTPYLVAEDQGEIVVARVAYREAGFPAALPDRSQFEQAAAMYLAGAERIDAGVRMDAMDFMVIGDDRALLRHHLNCLATDWDLDAA